MNLWQIPRYISIGKASGCIYLGPGWLEKVDHYIMYVNSVIANSTL